MTVKSFRELLVWQKAMLCAKLTYELVRSLPKEEQFGLSDQMRRAAVSIPSNIAEGATRNSRKEFSQYIDIAQGSRAELETQLELCVEIGYLRQEETEECNTLLTEIACMLYGLKKALISG